MTSLSLVSFSLRTELQESGNLNGGRVNAKLEVSSCALIKKWFGEVY